MTHSNTDASEDTVHIRGSAKSGEVWVDGERLEVPETTAAPDEFGWGHEGPEARLLAEALLTLYNPPEVARDRADWLVAAHVSEWAEGEDISAEIPRRHVGCS